MAFNWDAFNKGFEGFQKAATNTAGTVNSIAMLFKGSTAPPASRSVPTIISPAATATANATPVWVPLGIAGAGAAVIVGAAIFLRRRSK